MKRRRGRQAHRARWRRSRWIPNAPPAPAAGRRGGRAVAVAAVPPRQRPRPRRGATARRPTTPPAPRATARAWPARPSSGDKAAWAAARQGGQGSALRERAQGQGRDAAQGRQHRALRCRREGRGRLHGRHGQVGLPWPITRSATCRAAIAPLERLLERVAFDPARDRLWFVGDLVNRGPDSLALPALREVARASAPITVLGNHDLHLRLRGRGRREAKRERDTLDDVLAAPDRDELLAWLRTRPLMHVEGALRAGARGPAAGMERRRARARSRARSRRRCARPTYRALLERMYGDKPDRWSDELEGIDRLRVVINAMTRLRVSTRDGAHGAQVQGRARRCARRLDAVVRRARAPRAATTRSSAAIGRRWGCASSPDLLALDSGCVWGRQLYGGAPQGPGGVRRCAARERQAEKTSHALLRDARDVAAREARGSRSARRSAGAR